VAVSSAVTTDPSPGVVSGGEADESVALLEERPPAAVAGGLPPRRRAGTR
jgi:hypothetical protein